MFKCISVDGQRESRALTEKLIRKIKWLRLIKSFAGLDVAAKACLENNIDLMFIYLHDAPVAAHDIALLKKIIKHGTHVIIMSSQIGVARSAQEFDMTNFVHLPTTTRGLWKAAMRALKITEYTNSGLPAMNPENLSPVRISLSN